MAQAELQARLDAAIDETLDVLDAAEREGAPLDPLQTIVARLQVRGGELDLQAMPPVLQMLLGGMLDT